MAKYRGPGPGEVVQLAEEVKHQWSDQSQWAKGVRYAIVWVMDENEQHPITRERSRALPNMKAIGKAATLAANDTTNDPQLSEKYCAGVKDCLEWITGESDSRPEQFQHPDMTG